MEEIKEEWEDFKKCTCRTFQDRCSNCMPREEMLAWWLKKLDLAVSKEREEKEMLADALLDMYGQYCSDGHMFMSAGEHASGVLERLGYAKFDDAGAIINTK